MLWLGTFEKCGQSTNPENDSFSVCLQWFSLVYSYNVIGMIVHFGGGGREIVHEIVIEHMHSHVQYLDNSL